MIEITADALVDHLLSLTTRRTLVGIAGAPASGKSTLAEKMVSAINAAEQGAAALLAMDGFHLDDRLLRARGDLARKGAPHTFDVGGFTHVLSRLRRGDEDVIVPVFDRSIEIARAGASAIPAATRIVIAEGNYLLLREPPWVSVAAGWDIKVRLDVPEEKLRARLEERWADMDPPARREKIEENDLPNARLMMTHSVKPDYVIHNI